MSIWRRNAVQDKGQQEPAKDPVKESVKRKEDIPLQKVREDLRLAVVFLLPLLAATLMTELAPWLQQYGIIWHVGFMPEQYAPGDGRGIIQMLLLIPILWTGRDFLRQGWKQARSGDPAPALLMLASMGAAVLQSVYTAVMMLTGASYAVLPPLLFFYVGLSLVLSLYSVVLETRWKTLLVHHREGPAAWLLTVAPIIGIIAGLSFFYTGIGSFPAWQIVSGMLVCMYPPVYRLCASWPVAVALEKARKADILVRDGQTLSYAGDVTIMLFDKTGTLSRGTPELKEIRTFNGGGERGLLSLAAAMVQESDLPEAAAVRRAAEGCELPECGMVKQNGDGEFFARCWREDIHFGNWTFMKRYTDLSPEAEEQAQQMADRGEVVWYLIVRRTLYGMFAFSDDLRPETRQVMAELKEMGVRTMVMTGDDRRSGIYLARQSGADQVTADLMPAQKGELVATLRQGGENVSVVGDSVNDVLALLEADLGIAVGRGSKIARDSSRIVLKDSNLEKIPYLLDLSRKCDRTITRNVRIAVFFSLLLWPAALGLTYLMGGPILNLWMLLAAGLLGVLGVALSTLAFRSGKRQFTAPVSDADRAPEDEEAEASPEEQPEKAAAEEEKTADGKTENGKTADAAEASESKESPDSGDAAEPAADGTDAADETDKTAESGKPVETDGTEAKPGSCGNNK